MPTWHCQVKLTYSTLMDRVLWTQIIHFTSCPSSSSSNAPHCDHRTNWLVLASSFDPNSNGFEQLKTFESKESKAYLEICYLNFSFASKFKFQIFLVLSTTRKAASCFKSPEAYLSKGESFNTSSLSLQHCSNSVFVISREKLYSKIFQFESFKKVRHFQLLYRLATTFFHHFDCIFNIRKAFRTSSGTNKICRPKVGEWRERESDRSCANRHP